MTAQILASELTTLISESKKKAPEVRNAADKALQELKSLSATSEAQTAADVRRRPHIVRPFVAACKTKNAKLALPAVNGLQRLVASGALTQETLPEVLEAFQESTSAGLDVQLKLLQSIPTLLQNYSALIQGSLQADVLQICSTLHQTKTAAISRTASATLQQAVSFLFEKLESDDDRLDDADAASPGTELQLGDSTITVTATASDAYRTLQDICLIVEGEKPLFIQKAHLTPTFGLEILESILTDHSQVFQAREEQQYLLRNRVMPLITRILSERLSFSVTVRVTRVLCIMLREHLDIIKEECEIPLSLLNHSLDTDASTPWRRALCMEAMRLLFSNSSLVLELFALFDEADDRRSIVQESLASFVRLAAEKPNLIGVGQHSSYPASTNSKATQEQAAAAAATDAGIISGDIGVSEVNVPGISAQWSVMRIPCLDILDKTDPPAVPDTYVYSMVLTCVNNLTEALAKIILPLTVPDKGPASRLRQESSEQDETTSANGNRQRQRSNSSATKYRTKPVPVNPAQLDQHPARASVQTIVALVTKCWPAILATSSTFLYAALDAEYYRGLVRSFQRITQIAGLLRLSTPRDAFLTTLAKAAVPSGPAKTDAYSGTPTSAFGGSPRIGSSSGRFNGGDGYFGAPESPSMSRRTSVDHFGPLLSQRNLMCLRALVNLAIALGPVLDQAWSIVLDTIQRASVLLANSGTVAMARDYRAGAATSDVNGSAASTQTSLGGEISAVESAVTRLIQSTGDYPNDSFKDLLSAICNLVITRDMTPATTPSLDAPPSQRPRRPSNLSTTSFNLPQNDHFAIAKIGEVARYNLMRLTYDTDEGGWTQLLSKLLDISLSPTKDATSRLMAADVIGSLTVESAAVATNEGESARGVIQKRSLDGLQALVNPLRSDEIQDDAPVDNTIVDIHRTALDALGAILERCGDSVIVGWNIIFEIIASTFKTGSKADANGDLEESAELISGRLARSAFGSLQLISSDFLTAVPRTSFPVLVDIASRFCAQKADLNLSLTAITICWNITDFIQNIALRKKDVSDPAEALSVWMDSQRRLLPITSDNRADVRNGVVHTLFRILDSAGDHLQPDTWAACLREIVFRLVEQNVQIHERLLEQSDEIQRNQSKPWTATSKIIIAGVGSLYSSYMGIIAQHSDFPQIWQQTLDQFSILVDLHSFEISTDVFQALSSIVEHLDDSRSLQADGVDALHSLWLDCVPVSDMRGEAQEGEKTMAAYVALQKQLLRLLQSRLQTSHIQGITTNLNLCLTAAIPAPYTSDVDSLTPLQREALDSTRLLQSSVPEASPIIIRTLAGFVTRPYTKSASAHTSAQLTFVAFSKEAMQQLEESLVQQLQRGDSVDGDALADSLAAFTQSIQHKYRWSRQGKEPSLWRRASKSGVNVVQALCASSALSKLEASNPRLWELVVPIVASIMHADLEHSPANEQIIDDESFDLDSAALLLGLVTDHLGSSGAANQARLTHVQALFRTSLLHAPGDVDDISLVSDPLTDLNTIRHGRTIDPIFNPRVRMCYFAFDQLLALVAAIATDTEVEQSGVGLELAKVAFPYLVLRTALPLKTFIADQPLRGHMPVPTSQRLELMHVLKSMTSLNCSPAAVLSADGKSHLALLAPLVNRALQHATRDAELSRAMRALLESALAQ